MYARWMFCLDRVRRWSRRTGAGESRAFKTVLSGNREAMAKFSMKDLEKILAATLTGMTVDDSRPKEEWIEMARDPRWKRLYTELTYQPMLECCNTWRQRL